MQRRFDRYSVYDYTVAEADTDRFNVLMTSNAAAVGRLIQFHTTYNSGTDMPVSQRDYSKLASIYRIYFHTKYPLA